MPDAFVVCHNLSYGCWIPSDTITQYTYDNEKHTKPSARGGLFLRNESYQGLIPLDTIYLFAFSSAFTQSSNIHSNYLNSECSGFLRF